MRNTTNFIIFCDDDARSVQIEDIIYKKWADTYGIHPVSNIQELDVIRKRGEANWIVLYVLTTSLASQKRVLEQLTLLLPKPVVLAIVLPETLQSEITEIEGYLDDMTVLNPTKPVLLSSKLQRILAQKQLKPITTAHAESVNVRSVNERLSKVLNISSMGYWWINFEVMDVYWSPELYKLFRIDEGAAKISFESFFQMIHPEDQHFFSPKTLANLPTNLHEPLDYRVILPDGEERWMRSIPSLVSERDGVVIVIEGTTQDITTFKQDEKKLQESQEAYRVLFENVPSMKVIFDSESHRIIKVNGHAEAFFGYTEKEFLDRKIYELFDQAIGREKALDEIIGLVKEGSFEAKAIRADNAVANVLVHTTYFELQGKPVVQFTIRDVTKEKANIDEILQLSLIVSKMDNAIIITDAEENIEFVNQSAEHLFGYSVSELIGNKPSMFQGKDTSDKDRKHIRSQIDAKQPFKATILNYTKTGKPIWIELSITPILNADGGVNKFIAIESDITIQKLRIIENELFSDLSHLLNTPGSLSKRLYMLLQYLHRTVKHSVAEMWLTNMDNTELNKVASHKSTEDGQNWILDSKSESRTKKGIGFTGKVWAESKPLDCNILEDGFSAPYTGKSGTIVSAMGIPIWYKTELIGVLVFYYTAQNPAIPYTKTVLTNLSSKLGLELKQKIGEEELSTFFNLSPDLMCIAGTDGNLKKVNKSFVKILGYPMEDFINKPLLNFIHPDDISPTVASISDISNNRLIQAENRIISKSGEVKRFSWTGFAEADQHLLFMVGREITREHELEVERIDYLKTLEIQNEKLRDIAWTQSHIVRAPLTRIMSVIDVLQNYKPKKEEKEFLLKSINQSAEELDTIIQEMIKNSSDVINVKS